MRKLKITELNRISVEEFKEAEKLPLVVVLDNIRSLHNIGSVFRTSDAFRIECIYLCGITATPPHPEMHKTALGAEFTVDWKYVNNAVDAVDNLRIPDIRSLGMGGNGVTQSVLFNPALVALHTDKILHLEYFNRYGVKELGTVGIGFVYPNPLLSAGVDISSFGYDRYRETLFRLSVGKRLNDRWKIGIGFQYKMLQTELWEEVPKQLSTDVGILFAPVDKLLIGMLIMNFPSVAIHKHTAGIKCFTGYSVQIGFQWEVINNLLIAGNAETNKQTVDSRNDRK